MTTAELTFDVSEFFHTLDGGQIDRGLKIIRGAAIIQLGEVVDDRPFFADEVTLQQVIEFAGNSLRARINHDGDVGGYVGRWQQFRIDGDTVRADLHIADIAAKARGPAADGSNLAEYVLGIAEEDAGAIGVSIAPKLDTAAMLKARRADGLYPIRITSLRAADLVDTPAATHSGLFSAETMLPDERAKPMKVKVFEDGSLAIVNDDNTEAKLPTGLSDLALTAEQLQAHCSDAVKSIVDAAVAADRETFAVTHGETVKKEFFEQLDKLGETFGSSDLSAILPVVKGEKDAATFRAERAEAALEAAKAENEKLQQAATTPGFGVTGDNSQQNNSGDTASADKAAFEANADLKAEFGSFEAFSAYQAADEAGLIKRR